MTLSSQPLPTIGAANATEDSKIRSLLSEIQGIVNGGIDSSNLAAAAGVTEAQLAAALVARLGLGGSGRGKSIIATSETTTSSTYTTLATPDLVTVTLPANGLLYVAYQATWNETTTNSASAAIHLNSVPLQAPDAASGTPGVGACAAGLYQAGRDEVLSTHPLGLGSTNGLGQSSNAPPAYPGDVTTGQPIGPAYPVQSLGAGTPMRGTGGPCLIFAAAGTYAVSIKFAAQTGGTVAVKNRKLWVWTLGF